MQQYVNMSPDSWLAESRLCITPKKVLTQHRVSHDRDDSTGQNIPAFWSYFEVLEPTSRVEVAFATADWGVLVSESLIWPNQSLCSKKHFVIGLLELPENLFWSTSKDKIIAKRKEWGWNTIDHYHSFFPFRGCLTVFLNKFVLSCIWHSTYASTCLRQIDRNLNVNSGHSSWVSICTGKHVWIVL